MNLMIRIYMFICVLLLVFDVIFLIIKDMRKHRYYPRNTRFEKKIRAEIERYQAEGDFSEDFASSLHKLLSKTQNLITLQDVIGQVPNVLGLFRQYIYGVMPEYKKKIDSEQAYYTYVISAFDYNQEKVSQEFIMDFMTFLDSKSLYTFINAMKAFYEFGNPHLLVMAIDKVDERSGFYHKKLLVDGLLSSKCDAEVLNQILLERFERYTVYTKECLLDYFRLGGFDIKQLCLNLLQDESQDREIRYSAMRYFAKYPYEAAKEIFVEILKEDENEWIEQLLSIQALEKYDDEEIRVLIKKKVTSSNWFVRNSALEYLTRHRLSMEEIDDILAKKDRYTNESLLYQYRDNSERSAYILKKIQETDKSSTSNERG